MICKERLRMITTKGSALLALTLAVSISALAAGQQQQQGRRNQQKDQPAAPAAAQNVGPLAQSKDEFDAYIALQSEQNPGKKIELADAFIAKYPNSDFVQYAHSFKVTAYSQTGNFKEAVPSAEKAIDAIVKFGEKLVSKADSDAKLTDKDKEALRKKDKNAVFLDKTSPQFQAFMSQSEQRILLLYQSIIQSYQQLNDAPKILEYGEKALGFKPDDLNTLATLSNTMAERPPTNEEERTKQMKRAEELANQALTQLPIFLDSPDGKNISAQNKAELTAQLHYTLGLIYLHQKRLGSSEQEFTTAIQAKSNDPITYYRLGIAYVQDMKNDQAMEALGKSVFLKGISEAGARDVLKQLYVQKNKSEQGLEDYIKNTGAKIGK
jgi:tetratricopeptide (TPR) repeat protein